MSVRSRIVATVAWGMVVILPLASCSAVTGSGGPSGPAGPSGSRVSAKPSSARVPTTTPSQSTLPVNFDGLPAPQACDPATPKLAPLNQLDRKTIDNPYVPGGGGQFITVDLGNGVTLPIKVFARDLEQPNTEGPITTYFNELKACFELLPGGPRGPFDEFSVEAAETTLLNRIEQEIQLGPAALRARRDQLIVDIGITVSDTVGMSLDEVVAKLGGDSAKVLSEARTKAIDNIDAALASNRIAPEQAAALRAAIDEGLLDQEFRDPHAGILVQGPDDPGELLGADPGNLVIEPEVDGKLAENSVVFFVIDPRIYQNKWDYYYWQKKTYVSETVKATDGKVCGSLWRYISSLEVKGVRCQEAVTTSTPMEGSSTEARWFQVRVYGVNANEGRGNYYQLDGAWRAS